MQEKNKYWCSTNGTLFGKTITMYYFKKYKYIKISKITNFNTRPKKLDMQISLALKQNNTDLQLLNDDLLIYSAN